MKTDIQTIKNTVLALLTAIIDVLSVFHVIHFNDAQIQSIYKLAMIIVTIVVWAYFSHYKNNNYTAAALEGTGLTRLLKMKTINNQSDEAGDEVTNNE